MKKNDVYILNQWKRLYPYGIAAVIIIFVATISGNFLYSLPVLFFILYAIFFLSRNRQKVVGELERFLKYESPDPLIEYYGKVYNLSKVQDKEIWLTYNIALVLCYYGRFDEAMQSLNVVDWEVQKIPYIQSLEVSIRALIEYLKPGNYREGLRLSYVMQRLGEINANVPGMKEAQDFYETYIEIGELLSGNIKEATIEKLEEKFKRTQLYPKLLIAWCLTRVYKDMGKSELSDEKASYIRSMAPYCKPLNVW